MARSLEQIIAESDPGYAGSRKTIQTQIGGLAGETSSQLEGLKAQATASHDEILSGARRRGMGVAFGGIPVAEQVKYDSTVFKPAMTSLYANQNARKTSLEEALNQLGREQRQNAMSIRESELGRDEQIRQFNEQMAWNREQLARQEQEAARQRAAAQAAAAASSAGIGAYLGGGGGSAAKAPAAARIERTAKGGFNFFDASGRPINAAQYSQLSGVGYRDLLSKMASAGDANAKLALSYVGNNGQYYINRLNPGNSVTDWNRVFGSLGALGASNSWKAPGR